MTRLAWADLTSRQRRLIVLLGVVQVSLLIATLADLRRRSPEEINGSRRMWTALAFLNWVGPMAYFWKGRRRREAPRRSRGSDDADRKSTV